MSTTFRQYLKKQKDRNDPIGDFARDALADKEMPRSNRLARIDGYLHARNACEGAIRSCREAFQEWKRQSDEQGAPLTRERRSVASLVAERCRACLKYIDDETASSEDPTWCDDCWRLNQNCGGVEEEVKRIAKLINRTIRIKGQGEWFDWPSILDYFAMAGTEARAVMAVPAPGWFVVESGLDTTAGGYLYAIFPKSRLKEEDWFPHLTEKAWTDMSDVATALDRARALHGIPLIPHRGRQHHNQPTAVRHQPTAVQQDGDGDFMRKALVRYYERDGQRAVWTNADNANDFLLSAALSLDAILPDAGDERRADMLVDYLAQVTEVASKLKGYKADVYEERVIIAGRWKPDEDAAMLAPADAMPSGTTLTREMLKSEDGF